MREVHIDEAHSEYNRSDIRLASRMQPLAPTGSIAITGELQRLTEGYFQFRLLGPAKIRDIDEPVNVYGHRAWAATHRLQISVQRGLTKFVGLQAEIKHALEVGVR